MKKIVPGQYLLPFVLIASLFFFWGFAHSILDILNKHYQDALVISKTRSALVQAMVYGGYFIMAIPAGIIIRKWGYKAGVLTGLVLYGIGALLFIPGEMIMSFNFFLVCLFVIGCGLTCLETASNPYIAVLGDEETSASRLNLAQSLNGLGWIVGPLVGGLLVFRGADGNSGSVALPYTIIGIAVLLIAIVIGRVKLPEIKEEKQIAEAASGVSLWHSHTFVFGLTAIFFYVAAQTEDKGVGMPHLCLRFDSHLLLCGCPDGYQQFLYQLCHREYSFCLGSRCCLDAVVWRYGLLLCWSIVGQLGHELCQGRHLAVDLCLGRLSLYAGGYLRCWYAGCSGFGVDLSLRVHHVSHYLCLSIARA